MKILFIARHGGRDQDPEGAVSHALRALGHEVTEVHEQHTLLQTRGASAVDLNGLSQQHDICLFFKLGATDVLEQIKCPKVFWFFDLVGDMGDPLLTERSRLRTTWMDRTAPRCLAGFCTDGDWVAKYNGFNPFNPHTRGKFPPLVHLMQGADERTVGPGDPSQWHSGGAEVLFTGGAEHAGFHHGTARAEWVRFLRSSFGSRFRVVGDYSPRFPRVVGRDLAHLIAASKIVVAPDFPITDRYWSNRVYLSCGMGAFLIHPHCQELLHHYDVGEEIVAYRSREELKDLIEHYLLPAQDGERLRIARAGYNRTVEDHLYRHRVAEMIAEVERRLK